MEFFPRYVNTSLRLHTLDLVLMSVIIRGRGRHVMGDHQYEEKSGSVGITHYGQVHDILTTRRGMDIYNVYLDLRGHGLPDMREMPREFGPVLSQILPLHPKLVNRLNRSVHFDVRAPDQFAELLGRIERELRQRPAGYEQAARSYFRVFLIECCREAMHGGVILSTPEQPEFPSWLERIRQELDTHFDKPVNLDDLAQDVRVSKGHLCRLFKAYSGKTVFEYLIDKRIGSAMMRLRSGNEKILAIALNCGFNDIAYFNRTFKRLAGATPRQYRAQAGGSVAEHHRPKQ